MFENPAQVGPQRIDSFGRVRTPRAESQDDDGNVVHQGAKTIASLSAAVDAQQELRERLAREHPKQWAKYAKAVEERNRRFEQDPRRRQKVAEFHEARRRGEAASLDLSGEWSRAARQAHAPEGRAARPATNQRTRGGRRGERASSSSSDDPGGDPEPHRTCGCGCGLSIDHKRSDAEFWDHTHAVRANRRRRSDAAGDYRLEGPPPALQPCRCGSETYLDHEGDEVCLFCGRWVDPTRLRRRNGWEKRVAEFTVRAVGDYRKPRSIPKREWRDWQRESDAATRIYLSHNYFPHNDRGGRPKGVRREPPAAS